MKILLCVSASIAIYKSCELVRECIKEGHEVKVVLSCAAKKMISPIIFEGLGAEVFTKDTGQMEHISLSRWCDYLLLCPATASTIAKVANGIGGNLLLDIFLARKQSVRTIIAPAMNVEMWNNPIVQENIAKLQKYNFEIINPANGKLACGESGIGKLASIAEIMKCLFFTSDIKVVITAGGTIEKLDDVRYMTNISTGKQALEIAKAFCGHDVTIVKAHTDVDFPAWCKVVEVESAKEMLTEVQKLQCDVFIASAAVADFTFNKVQGKIKKQDIESLQLVQNPDILKIIATGEVTPKCVVGFAAESENLKQNALKKLQNKGCDFIVGNALVFGKDETSGIIVSHNQYEEFDCLKRELARKIVVKVMEFLNN